MQVGCYVLDLYCDANLPGVHKLGEPGGSENAAQYTAELGETARAMARRRGWLLRRDGTAICKRCRRLAARDALDAEGRAREQSAVEAARCRGYLEGKAAAEKLGAIEADARVAAVALQRDAEWYRALGYAWDDSLGERNQLPTREEVVRARVAAAERAMRERAVKVARDLYPQVPPWASVQYLTQRAVAERIATAIEALPLSGAEPAQGERLLCKHCEHGQRRHGQRGCSVCACVFSRDNAGSFYDPLPGKER